MRKNNCEMQDLKVAEMMRVKQLEQENGLLKLLYADLLQKFSMMKDGLTRNAGTC